MVFHGINFDAPTVAAFCRRWGVVRLSLFGSILTDHFGPESDIDVLVEFEPDIRIGLFGLGTMQAELIEMLGRQVDLRLEGELSEGFRNDVLGKAVVLHAA